MPPALRSKTGRSGSNTATAVSSVWFDAPPRMAYFSISAVATATYPRALAGAGVICAVVEPGIDGTLAARTRGIDPVICARLEDLHLPQGCIAAAGMFDVLEHINDEAVALRRVHSFVRPGGRLFLTVPVYQFLFSTDDISAGHFRRYTISRLGHALFAAGFRVEFASYIFAPLPPPPLIFFQRTLPSRLGLRRGVDAARNTAQHVPRGLAAKLMDRLLAAELHSLHAGRRLPIGGSCMCVAVKLC
jgi:SAM-dependent methyltransferase